MICHEHVSYYALRQIEWMAERAGLKVLDVELNDVNGGSFCITAAKSSSSHVVQEEKIQQLRDAEIEKGYGSQTVYVEFKKRAEKHRDELRQVISDITRSGKIVCGYGASTKGNVLLQYCGFTREDIPAIAEVNQDKFGCYTPHPHPCFRRRCIGDEARFYARSTGIFATILSVVNKDIG